MTRNEIEAQTRRDATLVVGFFQNREDADRAVEELREVEFPASDIQASWRSEAGVAPFDSEVNPGLNPETAYDPTTYPSGPETSRGGGSPFTQSEEELSWEKDANFGEAGNKVVDLSNTAAGGVDERRGIQEQDPVSILGAFGLTSEAARMLAPRLHPGSAAVSVATADRAGDVRDIFERNQGSVFAQPFARQM